jgi:hypothetical protein
MSPSHTPRMILAFWLVFGLLIVLLAGRQLLDPERVATQTSTLFLAAFVLFGGTLIILAVVRWLRNPPTPPPPGRRKKPRR